MDDILQDGRVSETISVKRQIRAAKQRIYREYFLAILLLKSDNLQRYVKVNKNPENHHTLKQDNYFKIIKNVILQNYKLTCKAERIFGNEGVPFIHTGDKGEI